MILWIHIFVVTVGLVLTLVKHIEACNPDNHKFKGNVAKLLSLEDPQAKPSRDVWGNVKVLDGCRFRISNLTISPPGLGVYWYAIPSTPPTEEQPQLLARVVNAAIAGYSGHTIDFSLTSEYEFDDIAVMLLYSEGDKKSYAAFGVNGKVKDYMNVPTKGVDLDFDPTEYANLGNCLNPSVSTFLGLVASFLFII